jgi:hypothetical protein
MGAEIGRRVEAGTGVVDGVRMAGMLESNDIFSLDLRSGARPDPRPRFHTGHDAAGALCDRLRQA